MDSEQQESSGNKTARPQGQNSGEGKKEKPSFLIQIHQERDDEQSRAKGPAPTSSALETSSHDYNRHLSPNVWSPLSPRSRSASPEVTFPGPGGSIIVMERPKSPRSPSLQESDFTVSPTPTGSPGSKARTNKSRFPIKLIGSVVTRATDVTLTMPSSNDSQNR